jgi:DNA invertase Pin-like site-specific DNA recombinase
MIEAVAYMRCSGPSQGEGDTWERQIEKISALAKAQELAIVKEWREDSVSGKIECEQRPAWQEMLAELLSNGCRTIVVDDLSRLARRYAVQEQILFYLCAKGITLWTAANGGENVTAAMQADPTKRLLRGNALQL